MANIKKILSCLLVAALLLSAMPLVSVNLSTAFSAFAAEREAVDGGKVNENISWTVYSDGTLTVSGEGDMPDFVTDEYQDELDPEGLPEWYKHRDIITYVVVEEGISSIGDRAFAFLYNVKNVSLSEGITEIGKDSFALMINLKEVELPSTVKIIGHEAFAYDFALKKINLPEGLETIGTGAFEACFSLEELIVPGTVKNFSPMSMLYTFSLKKFVMNEGSNFEYRGDDIVAEEEMVFAGLFSLEYLSIPSTVTTEGTVSLHAPFLKELRNASMRFAVKNPVSVKSTSSAEYQINMMLFDSIYSMVSSFIDDEIDGMMIYEDFDMDEFMYEICGFDFSLIESFVDTGAVDREEMIEILSIVAGREDTPFSSYTEAQLDISFSEEINSMLTGVPYVSNTMVYCYDNSAQHDVLKDGKGAYSRHILLDDNKECSDELVLEGTYTKEDNEDYYFSYRIDTATRTLILDGYGDMPSWSHPYDEEIGTSTSYPPWVNCSHLYDTIIFAEGSNITSISEFAFVCSDATDIYIPSSVQDIANGAFFSCKGIRVHIAEGCNFNLTAFSMDYTDSVTEYIVDENNTRYFSYDGALYFRQDFDLDNGFVNGTEISAILPGPMLLNVPNKRTEVTIMDGTKTIGMYAFAYSDVEEINLPDSVEYYMPYAAMYCMNLKSLNLNSAKDLSKLVPGMWAHSFFVYCYSPFIDKVSVTEENEAFFIHESGAVLSKDKKVLHYYPEGIPKAEFAIPEGVESAGVFALGVNEYVKSLVIPASMKVLSEVNCFFLNKLTVLNPELEIEGDLWLNPWTVIYGYPGSTAEAYAAEYGHEFVPISGCVHSGGTATCESLAVCDLCGQEYGTLGDHIPESYTENESCTVNGYTMTYCAVCFEELDFEVIEAKHLWPENYTVITSATCTQEGLEKRTCQRCPEEDNRVIPVAEHDYNDEFTVDIASTCTENGSMSRHCKNCSTVTDVTEITAPGHSFSEWTTVKEATFTEKGLKERICITCLYTETEDIPVLEHKTYEDKDSGVKVTVGKDAYNSNDIQVDIKEVFDGSHYLIPGFSNQKAWDITTLIGGEETQPAAPVYVQIPLPEDFNAKKVVVYHINSQTGEREKVATEVIDGYVCFYAASFSVYIIVDESSVTEGDIPVDCGHICHNKGFFVIFWKIIQFFSKLFNINPVCECGAAHY